MANITLTRHDIVDHTDAALINGPEGKDLLSALKAFVKAGILAPPWPHACRKKSKPLNRHCSRSIKITILSENLLEDLSDGQEKTEVATVLEIPRGDVRAVSLNDVVLTYFLSNQIL